MVLVFSSLMVAACAQMPALSQTPDQWLTLEAAAARKAVVRGQLKELDQANLSEAELEAARDRLGQMVAALTAFEEASQRRYTYEARTASLPRRLEEAVASRRQLEARPPSRFSDVNEPLRAEHDARRQALEAELHDLITQAASGGARLTRLPEEIRELGTALEKLERERQEAGQTISRDGFRVSQAELLDVQIQGHRAGLEALEAERLWLIERGPLQDALIRIARLRLEHARDDLGRIQAALGKSFQERQETLQERIARLQETLTASTYPAATIPLRVRLQTAHTQRDTADYQQQLARLRKEVGDQEALNSQVRQDTSRLVSLAEQYAGGERVVQRLLIKFEHLHRERRRFTDNLAEVFTLPAEAVRNPLQLLGAKLDGLNERLFGVDDQLYEFDRLAGVQMNQLTGALLSASPNERLATLAGLRADLELQRTALREQQRVLADLTQTASRLVALHDEHRRLLDEGYRLVLSKMFWLRNSDTLGWALVGGAIEHAWTLVSRTFAAMRSDLSRVGSRLQPRVGLWGLLVLLLVVLPLMLGRIWSHLRGAMHASLAASRQQERPPRVWGVVLLVLQAALWPAYLVLLGWSRQFFLLPPDNDANTASALISGIHLAAAVLGIGLVGHALVRRGGWAQQSWQLDDAGCVFLRRTFWIGCLGGLLFLVPRQIVVAASPDPFLTGGSQTMERLLMLAFQGVVFVLAIRVGWPRSPLMARLLVRSREQDGLLWRVWPFILIILLTALAGVMILDILGYRYTAHFIWLRALETLAIVLGSRLMLVFILMYGAQRLVRALYEPGGRWHNPARQQAAERSLDVFRSVSQFVLSAVALLLILELWGISVWSALNSRAGSQIVTRALVASVTIASVMVVIRVSNVLAEYIVRPRLSAQGEAREMGRKLRTLIPLVQTILKVVVVFIAVLVLLEQINVRTAPLLAGLGLFGLAVGLASQSLIKDVINGLFILFEDSISVGDVATLRGISGVIEKITLRAVVLRDLQGDVHVIPNSTIDLVTNMTKVFSRYLLDVGVAYREDVDTVMDSLREVDADMRRDMRYGYNMLEPIEIWGLDRFGDSAVYIRARLKTRPGKQWEVGREFNRRMKKLFDERGIEIPFPHRTVYWGVPKDGAQPSIRLSVNDPGT
jgi:small-conductance mechanosensitive channel